MKLFGRIRARGATVKAAFSAVLVVGSAAANAALPAWAASLATDVGGAITDTATAVGPLVIASLVAIIIIKLIKRFANKI